MLLLGACGDGGTGPDTVQEVTIDSQGGTVTSADGRVTLLVPANALAGPAAISIRAAPASADSRLLPGSEYIFEPDGLRFATPARLTIRYDSIPASLADHAPYIWLHRRTGSSWTPMAGEPINLGAKTITGQIDGFSNYGGATSQLAADILLALQQLDAVLTNAIPQNVIGLLGTLAALLQGSTDPAWQALVQPVLDQMATTACNAFASAVDNARAAPIDDWGQLLDFLAPVYSWEAVVVKLGMTNGCPNAPLTLEQIQTLKIHQFVTFYLTRLDPSSLGQNIDRLIDEVRFVLELRSSLLLYGLPQYEQALIADAQYPLMRELRTASYQACRDQGRHEFLGRLLNEVAASDYTEDGLSADLQNCATRLSWRVTSDDQTIDENGMLGGGAAPGTATLVASAPGVGKGTVTLSGDVREFQCTGGSFAGDELIVTLGGQEVHRRSASAGSFFASPLALDVETILGQAGIDPAQSATVPLVASRESTGCGQYVQASDPVTLATIQLAYPPTFMYFRDFSTTAGPEWSSQSISTSPNGHRFLGVFNAGGPDLTLTGLGPHARVKVEFDLYIIGTWDGNNTEPGNGPDLVTISIDGAVQLRTTFSNVIGKSDHLQSFPDAYQASHPSATGAAAIGSLGYPGRSDIHGDAVYRLTFDIDHTASTVKFSIRAAGLSAFPDEYWGVDNVRVTTR
jgi:hypothetical protein